MSKKTKITQRDAQVLADKINAASDGDSIPVSKKELMIIFSGYLIPVGNGDYAINPFLFYFDRYRTVSIRKHKTRSKR